MPEPKLLGAVLGTVARPVFVPDVTVNLGALGGGKLELAVSLAEFGEVGLLGMDDWRVLLDGNEVECTGPLADLIDATFEKQGLDAFGINEALDAKEAADREARAEDYSFDRRLELASGWRGY